jgi:hypothetical protein
LILLAKKRGRPPKFETPEQLEKAVDDWIESCRQNGRPITLTGSIIGLGMSSKETLWSYGQKEGFSKPVKKLRLAVEAEYEARLHGSQPTGAIFALKNMGWSDKTEHELTGKDGGSIKTDNTIRVEFVKPGDD